MATANSATPTQSLPSKKEELKAPTKSAVPENEKRCYVLRVKRKKAEKPAASLILETIELPDRRKRLRVLPPEDYVQEELDSLGLEQKPKDKLEAKKPMLFQRIEKLDDEAKKAKEIKVNIEGECELFEVNAKAENEKKYKRLNIIDIHADKHEVQKEKVIKEHEKMGKQKRLELISQKRKEVLTQLHDEKVKEEIKELKEKDDTNKADILYCNEKPLTLEYGLSRNFYRDYNNLLNNVGGSAQSYSEYAYDYYKYYIDDSTPSRINLESDLDVMYDPYMHSDSESNGGSDSEDSNREDHPLNEYPDSDLPSDEEEDYETVADRNYKKNVNAVLDKFIRKKANYAGNQYLIERSAEAEERDYVGEIYDDPEDDI